MSFHITQRQDVMGHPGRKVFDMRPPVRASGGAMPFSGIVRMNLLPAITIDTAETGATKFLYMHSDGSHTWAATMPDTQPADGRVFDLTQTAGDIQILGVFAG